MIISPPHTRTEGRTRFGALSLLQKPLHHKGIQYRSYYKSRYTRAQWYDVRPRVPHNHNHKGKLGNAGLLFSLQLC